MQSRIIYPKAGALDCEIECPKAVRYEDGKVYCRTTDLEIFVCRDRNEHGRYPVKYQIYRDEPFYETVLKWFM